MVSQVLREQTVSLSVQEETIENVITLVSRQVGSAVVKIGRTYFLGDVSREDRGILVTRISRLDRSSMESVVSGLLSDVGEVTSLGGGIVIVSDTVSALRRVAELAEQIEKTTGVTWAVQLYVMRDSVDKLKALGVDFAPAADLGYTFAAASTGLRFSGDLAGQLSAGLGALLRADDDTDMGSSVFSPFLLIQDGETATISDGTRRLLPISTQSVETNNSVRTGYQELTVGMSLSCTIREVDAMSGRLDLSLELSDADTFDEFGPVISDQSLETVVEVIGGGVYLVGSLTEQSKYRSFSKRLRYGEDSSVSDSSVDVWCRVYRIGGASFQGGMQADDRLPISGSGRIEGGEGIDVFPSESVGGEAEQSSEFGVGLSGVDIDDRVVGGVSDGVKNATVPDADKSAHEVGNAGVRDFGEFRIPDESAPGSFAELSGVGTEAVHPLREGVEGEVGAREPSKAIYNLSAGESGSIRPAARLSGGGEFVDGEDGSASAEFNGVASDSSEPAEVKGGS